MSLSLQAADGVARRLAEQYINTYCRETALGDPRLTTPKQRDAGLAPHVAAWRRQGWMPFAVDFAGGGARVAGAFSYFSPIGYHRLASELWLNSGTDGDWVRIDDVGALSDLIAAELAASSTAPGAAANRDRLATSMRNSIAKVARFHRDPTTSVRADYVASEQGLLFGHIFHVTSKASDGFDDDDLRGYAPELGAAFQLHYFAVRADLMDMRAIDRKAVPIDPAAMHFAEALLREGDYRLLPCHPWQARYLLGQPDIATLARDGAVIPLGPLGEQVWPTSSVRTVWLPAQQLFLKLSLNIRITNFVRNNPDEQVARALDASTAIGLLPGERLRHDHFRVLREVGSATLKVPSRDLRAACAVVYRQAMPLAETGELHLVAALLEESALGHVPLGDVVRRAAGGAEPDAALLERWWLRYLDVTLVPMLELYADYGVSLEAHLQNTLVAFEHGWPRRGYARDMEGTSISRQRFPFADRLAADSPALYDEAQAWHRFQYYVLVNHIGHMAACLGRLGWCTEGTLWRAAAARLRACSGNAHALVESLLRQPTLPAKANMLSSFHQHGETPAWIAIPNPLKA
jgi:siderophore synthetase component